MTDKKRPPVTFVQLERSALLPWERLIAQDALAARLLARLLVKINRRNAIVMSQSMMAKMLKTSPSSIKRAVRVLREGNWIRSVRVGNMTVLVVSRDVVWTDNRELRTRVAEFDALIFADAGEQDADTLDPPKPLNQVPFVVPPEEALLTGDQIAAGQQQLPGFSHVLEGESEEDA